MTNGQGPPAYEQVLTSKLFQMPRGADDSGWAGLLLSRQTTPPADPITVKQGFVDFTSIYLFALEPPNTTTEASVQSFIDGVRAFMDANYGGQNGKFDGQACLWIEDPKTPSFGIPGAISFTFARTGISAYSLTSSMNNQLGNQITFSLVQTALIAPGDDYLEIKSLGQSETVLFVTNPPDHGPSVSPNQTHLKMTGRYSGCCLIGGQIKTRVMLPFFNQGMRYAHMTPDGNQETAPIFQQYPVIDTDLAPSVINYFGAIDPLDPTNTDVRNDLHPTGTVDPQSGWLRTLLAVTPGGSDGVPLASFFRTSENRLIHLVGQGGGDLQQGPAAFAAGLVFAFSNPETGIKSPALLTYTGDWGLQVADQPDKGAGAGATLALLPGLFGSETMTFRAFNKEKPYDRLRFLPNYPAYAPIFPFKTATLNDPNSGSVKARLEARFNTAYGLMVDGENGDVQYQAQPEASPLFNPPASGATANGSMILDVFEAGTKLEFDPDFMVPITAYSGLTSAQVDEFNPRDVSVFESQILSPTRKNRITAQSESRMRRLKSRRRQKTRAMGLAGVDTTLTTTPQGLLASVAKGGGGADYVKVVLAQTQAAPKGANQLAFVDLELELQNLFQTNQLFSVIVNPAHLGKQLQGEPAPDMEKPYFQNTVTISDWTMTAAVGEGVLATDYRNVMIMKFGDGTVLERVANPNKWIGTENFSLIPNSGDPTLALTGLSQWLQDFLAEGIAEWEVRKNPLYRNFSTLVQDPNWNGILVLRTLVDPSGFPDQLRGLTAGIDFSQFETHHFGVTVSRVKVEGNQLTIDGLSSSFGLIDYQLPQFRQNVTSGGSPDVPLALNVNGRLGFTVLQLQALFENAALKTFISRVQLTTNELFDSKVVQTFNTTGLLAANGVVLKGTSQAQDGGTDSDATYVFKQDQKTIFQVDSNLFNAIAFNRVQFNTLSANTGGDDPQILSRFLIWGEFDFVALEDRAEESFDVLSFGTDNDESIENQGKGLAFANLQVDLSSPVPTPNAVSFSFDSSGIGFDLAASTSRDNSLFPTFALQLDSFIAESGSKRPVDFGYLPVATNLNLKSISGPWFGVVYKVTMGTPGALVSEAGFESRMLLAWSPETLSNDKRFTAFVGLQLPGAAPGAKLISLQGVLKLSIGNLQLIRQEIAGGGAKAFNLKLTNVGLKFLGIVKLPPGATINFFLFGDPSGSGSLGWYAAYIKDSQNTKQIGASEDAATLVPLDPSP